MNRKRDRQKRKFGRDHVIGAAVARWRQTNTRSARETFLQGRNGAALHAATCNKKYCSCYAVLIVAATLCGSCFPMAVVAQEGKLPLACAPGKWPPVGPTPGAIVTATSPESLLKNIRQAVESHWFETRSLYADDALKAIFGVLSLKRYTVSVPAYPPMNRPAGVAEYIRADGKLPAPRADGDKTQYLEYSLDLGRALSGELDNHLLQKMQIRILRYEQYDVPLTYQQVVSVFGKDKDSAFITQSRPTDGAIPKMSVLFYTCATKGGQESLTRELDHDGTIDKIEFDVEKPEN